MPMTVNVCATVIELLSGWIMTSRWWTIKLQCVLKECVKSQQWIFIFEHLSRPWPQTCLAIHYIGLRYFQHSIILSSRRELPTSLMCNLFCSMELWRGPGLPCHYRSLSNWFSRKTWGILLILFLMSSKSKLSDNYKHQRQRIQL